MKIDSIDNGAVTLRMSASEMLFLASVLRESQEVLSKRRQGRDIFKERTSWKNNDAQKILDHLHDLVENLVGLGPLKRGPLVVQELGNREAALILSKAQLHLFVEATRATVQEFDKMPYKGWADPIERLHKFLADLLEVSHALELHERA